MFISRTAWMRRARIARRALTAAVAVIGALTDCTCIRTRMIEESQRAAVRTDVMPTDEPSSLSGSLVCWVGMFETWADRAAGVSQFQYVHAPAECRRLPRRDALAMPAAFTPVPTEIRFLADVMDLRGLAGAKGEWPSPGDLFLLTGRVTVDGGVVRLNDAGQRPISLQRAPAAVADLVPGHWAVGKSALDSQRWDSDLPAVLLWCGDHRDRARSATHALLDLDGRLPTGTCAFGVGGDGFDRMRDSGDVRIVFISGARSREFHVRSGSIQRDLADAIAAIEGALRE